ncbi:MAG: hypothetical protein ABIR79_07290 [Candidatus Binatia bacterium]
MISRSNGTAFQGAYVIARRVGDPRLTAVGVASGARYASSSSSPSLKGLFEIPGLPPGDYTVEIEQIDPSFTGGSSVGPVDPPATLPGPAEFWNGANESGTSTDVPSEASVIAVGAATAIGSINLVINDGTTGVSTATATPAPTATRTPTPVRTATRTATPVATATATRTATPSATGTAARTATPGAGATETPGPTATPTANGALTCGAVPEAGCRKPTAPQRAALMLKDRDLDTRDTLRWKWTRGAATVKGDFGDPLTTTSYALCVYDETAAGQALVLSADIAASGLCAGRSCWQENTRGFRYTNREGTAGGVTSLTLKAGDEGKAQIALKGLGTALAMPTLPFTQDPRVTVQLKNDLGLCWDATFSAPATKTTDTEFRDKSD